jgi:hypothetical protein
MPLEQLLEHRLPPRLDNIPMARNDALKVPLVDPRRRLCKRAAITGTRAPPNHPLLAQRGAARMRQRIEDFGQDARLGGDLGLAELLRRRRVEEVVGLDHRARRLVVEHYLLVCVRPDVLPVELCVELGRDCRCRRRLLEHDAEGDGFFVRFCARLREAFGTEDLGVGVRRVPGAEEQVVLRVRG